MDLVRESAAVFAALDVLSAFPPELLQHIYTLMDAPRPAQESVAGFVGRRHTLTDVELAIAAMIFLIQKTRGRNVVFPTRRLRSSEWIETIDASLWFEETIH